MERDHTVEDLKEVLIPQLAIHEGRRPYRYFDSEGIPTIGIGFNMTRGDARKIFHALGIRDFDLTYSGQKPLSGPEIDALFRLTIDQSIEDAKNSDVAWDELSLNRKAVIVDMVFNLGKKGFEGFVNTRRMIREGQYEEASRNMLYSKWRRQVKNRALRLSYMLRNDAPFEEAVQEIG